MPTFKAIVIRKTESGQTAELTDFDATDLMEGDVTFRVEWSTVNYKDGLAVTRLIVAAAHESPDRHAGRLPRLDAANAVLDHEGTMRIYLHPFGRVNEEVGRGLAALHHLRGIDPRVEMQRQTSQGK